MQTLDGCRCLPAHSLLRSAVHPPTRRQIDSPHSPARTPLISTAFFGKPFGCTVRRWQFGPGRFCKLYCATTVQRLRLAPCCTARDGILTAAASPWSPTHAVFLRKSTPGQEQTSQIQRIPRPAGVVPEVHKIKKVKRVGDCDVSRSSTRRHDLRDPQGGRQ